MTSIYEKSWMYLEKASSALGTTVLGAIQILIVIAVLLKSDPTMTSLAVGSGLAMAGVALRIWAVGFGAKAGAFVLKGPYLFVRHPFFLGTVLFYMGICFAGRSIWVTMGSLVFLVFIIGRNLEQSETKISKALGLEYTNYQATVPAFLPRLFPYSVDAKELAAGFSLRKALIKNGQGELSLIILLVLVLASLYVSTLPIAYDWFEIVVVAAAMIFILIRLIYFKKYRQQNRLQKVN